MLPSQHNKKSSNKETDEIEREEGRNIRIGATVRDLQDYFYDKEQINAVNRQTDGRTGGRAHPEPSKYNLILLEARTISVEKAGGQKKEKPGLSKFVWFISGSREEEIKAGDCTCRSMRC